MRSLRTRVCLGRIAAASLLALAALVWWGIWAARAQSPEIKAWFQTDRPTLTVGDQARLALYVQGPASVVPVFPNLPAQWGSLEVLAQRPLKPRVDAAGLTISGREYIVTAFSVGEHPTPALEIIAHDAAGQRIALAPAPLTFTVRSVLTDTEEADLRDLKPQADLPPDPRPILWGALGALSGAALALTGILWARRLRRRQLANVAPAPIDARPPDEIAYAELARIEALCLIEAGDLKQHYSLTADCLRRYVGARYDVPALDRTTDELERLLRRHSLAREAAQPALDVLREADLVKFAKARPAESAARSLLGRVRAFVDQTRPPRSPTDMPARSR